MSKNGWEWRNPKKNGFLYLEMYSDEFFIRLTYKTYENCDSAWFYMNDKNTYVMKSVIKVKNIFSKNYIWIVLKFNLSFFQFLNFGLKTSFGYCVTLTVIIKLFFDFITILLDSFKECVAKLVIYSKQFISFSSYLTEMYWNKLSTQLKHFHFILYARL